jgi:hypothetical protein
LTLKDSAPTPISADDLLADRPLGEIELESGSLDDLDDLNHRVVAQRVAEIVQQSPGRLNIALFGPWGSGKSSFFSLLKKRLDTSIGVVEFDAWKYAGTTFHRNFLSVLGKAVNGDGDRTDEKLFQSSRTVTLPLGLSLRTRSGFSLWWILVPIIALVVFGLAPTLYTVSTLPTGDDFLATLGGNIAGWATFGATTTIAFVLVGLVLDFAKVNVQESAPSEIAQFGKIFDRLLKGDKRWVVFIDELDRCGSKDVVMALEGLRTFLNHPKVTFVVAFDRKSVAAAIRKSADYETPRRPEAPYYSTAGEYIDKIFQYQLSLPPQPEFTFRRLALTLTSKQPRGIWADIRDADEAEYKRVVSLLSPAHLTSPRRTKVLLNDFAVNARIYESINESWRSRLEEIAILTVLQTEFPDFYAALERRPEILAAADVAQPTRSAASILKQAGVAEVETVLTPPPVTSADEADQPVPADDPPREGAVAREELQDRQIQSELAEQLSGYLARVIGLGLQLPRADLVLMHSGGDLLAFDDSSIYNLVRIAPRSDFGTVISQIEGASENDRLRAVEYLTEQLEVEGPLESRSIASLLGPILRSLPSAHAARYRADVTRGWRLLVSDPRTASRVVADYAAVIARDGSAAESTEFLSTASAAFGPTEAAFLDEFVDSVPESGWAGLADAAYSAAIRVALDHPQTLRRVLARSDGREGSLVAGRSDDLAKPFVRPKPADVEPETATSAARAAAVEETTRLTEEWQEWQANSRLAFTDLVEGWEDFGIEGGSRGQILRALMAINKTHAWAGDLYVNLAQRDRDRGLGVVPRKVVQPRDGRDLADGGVESVLIVEVQPCREGVAAG